MVFPLEFRTGKTQLSHTMCGKLRGSHMHAVCIIKHIQTFVPTRCCSWFVIINPFVMLMKDSQWTNDICEELCSVAIYLAIGVIVSSLSSVTTQLPGKNGYSGGKVVFVDTEVSY